MRNELKISNDRAKKFGKYLEKIGVSPYKLAKDINEGKNNVYNFIKNGDTKYSMLVKISELHPEIVGILFSLVQKNEPIKNTSPPILQKAENYIRVTFQNHIIPIGDTIGTSATTTSTTIDTARIYYIVTRTTTLIKYLERDPTDASILHCHTPKHPSFTISISDIQELHLVIFKISLL